MPFSRGSPDPGNKPATPASPALQASSLCTEPRGLMNNEFNYFLSHLCIFSLASLIHSRKKGMTRAF